MNHSPRPTLTIAYGSATGNCEDVARTLWRRSLQYGLDVRLRCMNDLDLSTCADQRQTVVFVCSTTGQGEMPDNMKQLWRALLRRTLPTTFLASWQVAVLGLGDSSYQKFNFTARKLQRRLSQLGAAELIELALADDQHSRGYDEVVDAWTANFWTCFLGDQYNASEPLTYSTTYQIVWLDEAESTSSTSTIASHACPADSRRVRAEIVENRRITKEDHFQDVRLISFSLWPNAAYNPGDVMVVQPKNLDETKRLFFDTVTMDCLDKPFRLKANFDNISVPDCYAGPSLTFRQLIGDVFDLQAVPRRSFFQIFSKFAVDQLQKERLEEFAAAEGQEDMHDYCTRPRRNVVEVLRDFQDTALRVPLEAWFDLLGVVQTRSFSIASCVDTHKYLELLVAVVNYKTIMSTPRRGLCSNWLSRLRPKDQVDGWIKTGSFKFPATETPVILIGPGTGVAPLRSFLLFRMYRSVRSSWLFFGCRNRAKDFLCEEDFMKMVHAGSVTLSVAFSRDQENKVYVQDKLKELKTLVYDLIHNRSAMVLISGNAKSMPLQVKEAIKDILKDEGGLNENEAQKYMRDMNVSMRLQLEVW